MAKNKKEIKPFGNIFDNFLKMHGLEDKYLIAKIKNNWSEIVGKAVANNTKNIFVEKNKLYIKVESSILKQELSFMKEILADKINKYLEKQIIQEIIIL